MTPDDRRAELERRAERVLAKVYGGIHNAPGWSKRKFDGYWMVRVDVVYNLATFDGDGLTRLVIAAHDECVRVEIAPSSPRRLTLAFSPRERDAADYCLRHPTMEQAIATVRGEKPADADPRYVAAARWLIAKAIEDGPDIHLLDCAIVKDMEERGTTDDCAPPCSCGLAVVLPNFDQARELGIDPYERIQAEPKEADHG